MEPDHLASVVTAADSAAVNDLLDELESLDTDDQLCLFSESYEPLLACLDSDDGYVRQSVVRIVSTLSPALRRLAVAGGAESSHDVDAELFETLIEREATLYAAALSDKDGRVRRAACRGINSYCVGCRLTDDWAAIDRLVGDLESLVARVDTDDERYPHIQEALDTASGQSGGL